MSHLFIHVASEWLVARLEQGRYALACGGGLLVVVDPAAPPRDAAALLRRLPDTVSWALLPFASPPVLVNGGRVYAGLHLLRHQDEIRGQDFRLFFSSERLAQVQPFPDPGRSVICARCRNRLEAMTPAVCCPRCNAWCHSAPELPCWTYSATCPLCDHRTDEASYSWTPSQI